MKIQFLKDTSKPNLPDLQGETIIIYKEGYKLPSIPNAKSYDFQEYKGIYTKLHPDNIVMVGTNRIFNPATRTELVNEYLQTLSSNINKISIDTAPFIGEPWRAWFHWSFVYGIWLNIKYSYAVETDWQHWFYRDSETSIIASENIPQIEVYSDLDPLQTTFDFYEPNKLDLEYYTVLKSEAFEKHNSPKLIIQYMLKNLNKHLDIDIDFESYLNNKKINLPELPIMRFVAEENLRRRDIYNRLLK